MGLVEVEAEVVHIVLLPQRHPHPSKNVIPVLLYLVIAICVHVRDLRHDRLHIVKEVIALHSTFPNEIISNISEVHDHLILILTVFDFFV